MKKILYILGITGILITAVLTKTNANRIIPIDCTVVLKTDTIVTDSIQHIAEVMPQYPEGEMAMMKFIANSLKYPITNQCEGHGIHGRVTVRFVVTKTGDIDSIKVVRGISPSIDKEAIRVVMSMPKWIPGKQNGKDVDVYYTLPVLFRMR